MARRYQGMTLFEVAISLLILSVAIVSTLMLFPMGLQAQQLARYQMVAAAKAVSVAVVPNHRQQLAHHRSEAEAFGNVADGVSVNAGPWRPDLHQRLNTARSGYGVPLPFDIARRLDSDGDEIMEILDEGGTVFYIPPSGGSGTLFSDDDINAAVPYVGSETQRLLFAIKGFPQQNILANHPNMAWPYYDRVAAPGIQPWQRRVYASFGLTQPKRDDSNNAAYYRSTSAVIDDVTLPGLSIPLIGDPDPAAYHRSHGDLVVGAAVALKEHAFASLKVATANSGDATKVEQARVDYDWAQAFMAYCQTHLPDDWRCPRPFSRSLMSDSTLLEYDLFGPVVTSDKYPERRVGDGAWKSWTVTAERPITSVASLRGSQPAVATASYDFGATRPFAAAERCRQLVVWVADWTTYEDFEQVPSETIDASRMMYHPHRNDDLPFSLALNDRFGRGSVWGVDLNHGWWGGWMGPAEWELAWWDATRQESVTDHYAPLGNGQMRMAETSFTLTPKAFFGRNGADRNGNGRFDRGTVPSSVRMRALTVARFNLYDSIGFIQLQ